jgi:hypothetical protein
MKKKAGQFSLLLALQPRDVLQQSPNLQPQRTALTTPLSEQPGNLAGAQRDNDLFLFKSALAFHCRDKFF